MSKTSTNLYNPSYCGEKSEKITCLLKDCEILLNEKAVIEEKTPNWKMTYLTISIILILLNNLKMKYPS